ncbi:MAG: hypothetical protein GY769_01025 [bacterium]|nr:hypothetical protein [bacterium]
MKRALVWTLALVFLVPAAWAADNGWPADLADVEALVASKMSPVPYDRVKVRRSNGVIDVSIKLKNLPRQLRTLARQRTEDDVFLGGPVVELFEPSLEFDIVSFDLLPIADRVSYYFGFTVFNFGRKIKLPASIAVNSGAGQEFENKKKKYPIKKNRLQLRFIERTVDGPGLHELAITVGPWEQLSYFCVSCG